MSYHSLYLRDKQGWREFSQTDDESKLTEMVSASRDLLKDPLAVVMRRGNIIGLRIFR